MARRRQIYEGKAKILYEGPEPGTLIQYFKDDATACNAQKKGTINGKGVLNNRISEHIFTLLGGIGVQVVQLFRIVRVRVCSCVYVHFIENASIESYTAGPDLHHPPRRRSPSKCIGTAQ